MSDGLQSQSWNSQWWGSHWKWRLALGAILLGLMASAYWLADQWITRRLVPSHSRPAIVRVIHRAGESVEAYDWTTGNRNRIAELGKETRPFETDEMTQVVGDGKAVAWHRGADLHLVDIEPPHQERVCRVPVDLSKYAFLGMSADAKHAVYQAGALLQFNADGSRTVLFEPEIRLGSAGRPISLLTIVDFESGQVTDTRQWESDTKVGWEPGEFTSTGIGAASLDPTDPAFAQWSISPEGKWQRVESTQTPREAKLFTLKDSNGQLRIAHPSEHKNPNSVPLDLVRWSRSGKRCLAYHLFTQSAYLVDNDSKMIQPLAIPFQYFTQAGFFDEETIVLTDLRDDVRVIDARSGKLIAIDATGSQRRVGIAGIAGGIVLVTACWLLMAFRERSLFWAMFDALMVSVVIQLALVWLAIAWDHRDMQRVYSRNLQFFTLVLSYVISASNVSAGTLVGWYWSHGRGWLLTRWAFGLMWLALSAIPIAIAAHFLFANLAPLTSFAVLVSFNVLLSGLVAFVTGSLRFAGWTIHNAPVAEATSRFGLAACFAAMSGIAVLIAVAQWLYGGGNREEMLFTTALGFGAGIIAIGLVAMMFSYARWLVQAVLWIFFLAAVAIGVSLLARHFSPPFQEWMGSTLCLTSVGGIILLITLPCLVLRAHGWHWVRVGKRAVVPQPLSGPQTA